MHAQVEGTTLRESIEVIDELVGQLLWAFISTKDDLEAAGQAARRGRLSGIWLLPTEMRSPADTVKLINWLQGVSPHPLLVGVDAEAGMGLVMGGATHLPTAMAIGATGDPQLAREAGRVTAEEAAACGINTVAAPVLDVNINPRNPIINTRSFGADPELVSAMGLSFVEGMRRGSRQLRRVLPIGKHFPGHGDTRLDSHLHLDTVAQSRERLDRVELPPFRAAIGDDIPLLMTAHVAYPALDPTPGMPATLSPAILTGLLRGEMGFAGALVTDCMNMHAVAQNFESRAAAVQSVHAGCDLLLTHQWEEAHEALVRAVLERQIPESRLREAAQRVRRVKEQIFGRDLACPPPVDEDAAQAGVSTRDHIRVAERIASASVTLVDGRLSMPSARPLIVATRMARRFGPPVEAQVRAGLTAIGWDQADVLMVDPFPDAGQIAKAVEHARAAGWAALLHFNRVQSFDPEAVLTSDELVSLTDAVAATGTPLAIVSMGSPYALPLFRRAAARLCCYSTCDASLYATLEVLKGTAQPSGHLPVALS
jgi:beta-N-acetylhexosaminidase